MKKTHNPFAGIRGKAANLWRSEEGVSAVEFPFIALAFAGALMAMVDVGLALSERMAIDHALRAGAQAAMSDPGEAKVLELIETTLNQESSPEGVTIDRVKRYCTCPDNTDVAPEDAPDCATLTCAGDALPYVYYWIEASKPFQPMSLPEVLPPFELGSKVQVEVR